MALDFVRMPGLYVGTRRLTRQRATARFWLTFVSLSSRVRSHFQNTIFINFATFISPQLLLILSIINLQSFRTIYIL